MIALIRKVPYEKCGECAMTCHKECLQYVPNLCGLPPTIIAQLRSFKKDVGVKEKMDKSYSDLNGGTRNVTTSLPEIRLGGELSAELDGKFELAAPVPPVTKPGKRGVKPGRQESLGFFRNGPKNVSLDDFCFLAVLGKGNFGKVLLDFYVGYACSGESNELLLCHQSVEERVYS